MKLRRVTKEVRRTSFRKRAWKWDLLIAKESCYHSDKHEGYRSLYMMIYRGRVTKTPVLKMGKEICVLNTKLGLPVLNHLVNGKMPQAPSFCSRSVENFAFYFPHHSSHYYYTTVRKIWCNCTSKCILLSLLSGAFKFLIKLVQDKDRHSTCNVFLRRVLATTVAVEKL
jgi:hypothetical protein